MSIASGGIVSGLLSGLRLGEEDNRRRDAYNERKRRDAEDDIWRGEERRHQREKWRTDAEDQAHERERRPKVEAQQDQQFAAGMENAELQTAVNRFKVSRLDKDAAQGDEEHALSVSEKKQRMGMAADNHSRASRLSEVRIKLEELGYTDKAIEQEITNNKRAIASAIMKYKSGGTLADLQEGYNASIGRATGQQIESIAHDSNDAIKVRLAGGKTIQVQDEDELFNMAAMALQPEVYISNLYANAHGLPDKDEPASIKETNAIFKRLKPQDGEDDSARWMRAYQMRSQKRGEDPEAAIAGFYESVVGKMLANYSTPEKARDAALKATRAFAAQFHGDVDVDLGEDPPPAPKKPGFVERLFGMDAPSAGTPHSFDQSAQPTQPMASMQPGQPAESEIVATAIDHNGRYGPKGGRVARLSDGRVVPLQ